MRRDAKTGLGDVAADDFDALPHEALKVLPVPPLQSAERGRAQDVEEPLFAFAPGARADKNVEPSYGTVAIEQHRQGDFADEAGGARQQEPAAGQGGDQAKAAGFAHGFPNVAKPGARGKGSSVSGPTLMQVGHGSAGEEVEAVR